MSYWALKHKNLRKFENALLLRVERKSFDHKKPDSSRTVSAVNFVVDEIVNRISATDNYVRLHGINEANIYRSLEYGRIHAMSHEEFSNVWYKNSK
ncbi:hypothetical protein ELVG_00212 [Emiliania huxleyi virus 203]|nr:hypothetical protein ELVG_00212 [Emiliania huxleyi virus 203]